jgi:hypothetical protein
MEALFTGVDTLTAMPTSRTLLPAGIIGSYCRDARCGNVHRYYGYFADLEAAVIYNVLPACLSGALPRLVWSLLAR